MCDLKSVGSTKPAAASPLPRERCLLARPVARVDGLGPVRDRSSGRPDSSGPGRGRQPDHITSDAGYLSRSASPRPYRVSPGGESKSLCCDGSKRQTTVSPPVLSWRAVLPPGESAPHCEPPWPFFSPSGKGLVGVCFFTSNRFCVNCSNSAARPFVARALQSNSFPDLGLVQRRKDKLL